MLRMIFALICALTLAGCMNAASVDYVVAEYKGIPVKTVQMPEDQYRIFDKPAAGKLMITPSLPASSGIGLVQGATFGTQDVMASKPVFERAALQYLAEDGRADCKITESYVVLRPQWEMKYICGQRPLADNATRKPTHQ